MAAALAVAGSVEPARAAGRAAEPDPASLGADRHCAAAGRRRPHRRRDRHRRPGPGPARTDPGRLLPGHRAAAAGQGARRARRPRARRWPCCTPPTGTSPASPTPIDGPARWCHWPWPPRARPARAGPSSCSGGPATRCGPSRWNRPVAGCTPGWPKPWPRPVTSTSPSTISGRSAGPRLGCAPRCAVAASPIRPGPGPLLAEAAALIPTVETVADQPPVLARFAVTAATLAGRAGPSDRSGRGPAAGGRAAHRGRLGARRARPGSARPARRSGCWPPGSMISSATSTVAHWPGPCPYAGGAAPHHCGVKPYSFQSCCGRVLKAAQGRYSDRWNPIDSGGGARRVLPDPQRASAQRGPDGSGGGLVARPGGCDQRHRVDITRSDRTTAQRDGFSAVTGGSPSRTGLAIHGAGDRHSPDLPMAIRVPDSCPRGALPCEYCRRTMRGAVGPSTSRPGRAVRCAPGVRTFTTRGCSVCHAGDTRARSTSS